MTHVPQQPSLRAADIMTPHASGIPLQLKSYRENIRVRQMQTVSSRGEQLPSAIKHDKIFDPLWIFKDIIL